MWLSVVFLFASWNTFADSVLIKSEVKHVHRTSELTTEERLAEVGFWVRRYHIPNTTSDGHHESTDGSQIYAWYRTKDTKDLEEFVFVQFIKGCVYDTFMKGNQVEAQWNVDRQFFGKRHPFIHPEWVVDSIDTDPVYWSMEDKVPSRHFALQWGIADGIFPTRLLDFPYFGEEKPTSPRLFILDTPKSGGLRWNPWGKISIATNASLRLKTCLYRKDEVPNSVQPEEIHFATPIVCMEWDNSYVYDHERKVMTSPEEISAQCTAPSTEEIEEKHSS